MKKGGREEDERRRLAIFPMSMLTDMEEEDERGGSVCVCVNMANPRPLPSDNINADSGFPGQKANTNDQAKKSFF